MDIAERSLAIVRDELRRRGWVFPLPWAQVVERVIHSTADFEFATLLKASPGAVEAGMAALRQGCAIVTDVHMVRVGIDARRVAALGGQVHCFISAPDVVAAARANGLTRAAQGIRHAAAQGLLDGGIVVIGNAPTALREALRQVEKGVRPALIIGVPVGFVDAAESKEALMAQSAVPWISTQGRKGGSPVAVAIVNALVRMVVGEEGEGRLEIGD